MKYEHPFFAPDNGSGTGGPEGGASDGGAVPPGPTGPTEADIAALKAKLSQVSEENQKLSALNGVYEQVVTQLQDPQQAYDLMVESYGDSFTALFAPANGGQQSQQNQQSSGNAEIAALQAQVNKMMQFIAENTAQESIRRERNELSTKYPGMNLGEVDQIAARLVGNGVTLSDAAEIASAAQFRILLAEKETEIANLKQRVALPGAFGEDNAPAFSVRGVNVPEAQRSKDLLSEARAMAESIAKRKAERLGF